MEKRKIKTRVLAFASTFVILITLLSTIAFAQAPNTNIDFYGSSPNLFVTAYKVQPSDIYPYSTPLWQYQACGFSYSEVNPVGSAIGDDFAVFFENYYNEYDLTDLYDNYYNFVVQIFSYTSSTSGTLTWFVDNSTLNGAIENSLFPLSDSPTFIESIESAYYNQFTYWENQIENDYNDGYNDGLTVGYTNALNDYKAFEKGLFAIFNAPFTFVSNITSFEIFGISLVEVVVFILIICLAFILLKFIGGSIL